MIADEKMLMLFMTCSRLCALATWMHVNVLMVSQQTNFYLFIQMIHIIDNVKWIFGFYCAISRWSGKQNKQRVREELQEETTPPSLPEYEDAVGTNLTNKIHNFNVLIRRSKNGRANERGHSTDIHCVIVDCERSIAEWWWRKKHDFKRL